MKDPHIREKYTREVKTPVRWRAIFLNVSPRIDTKLQWKVGGICRAIITNLR
jgi:hypothetical protein